VYAFAWQVYGDFSGYSDIARGSAQIVGIPFYGQFPAALSGTAASAISGDAAHQFEHMAARLILATFLSVAVLMANSKTSRNLSPP